MTDAIGQATRLVPDLVRRGAAAVVLTGSHARGEATAASDLDVMVVGDGPGYMLEVQAGMLVAQSWAPEAEHRSRMQDPAEVGTAIRGWRDAVLLHDPTGVAAQLRQAALDWRWGDLGDRCDAWVAEELTGHAEEVQKLVAARTAGQRATAAVQRNVLALRLAPILAVHLRQLSASENTLWDQVAGMMGERWAQAQGAAFGLGSEDFDATCAAALTLFRLAVERVRPLLDGRQLRVAEHALTVAAG